ncbi:MAG: hypothetical protein ABSF50_17270 [Burkholderiaceae bacterium]|jgi:hypothetical protein
MSKELEAAYVVWEGAVQRLNDAQKRYEMDFSNADVVTRLEQEVLEAAAQLERTSELEAAVPNAISRDESS